MEAKCGGTKDKIRQLAKESKPTGHVEAALRDLQCDKPEPPKVPRLLYSDATPEALAFAVANEWPSAGVVSAEGGTVLGAHGMNAESVMRNLSLLNVLWDGGTIAISRRTSESFTVRGARLTVALQVQEATLQSFLDRYGLLARGIGFLARFLIAKPESTQGFRPFTEAPRDWPALDAFNRRIGMILYQPVPVNDVGLLAPPALSLGPEAKAAWVGFHDRIETELRRGGDLHDVRDVASKAADNVARLAALFHVFSSKNSDNSSSTAIGVSDIESASRIVAWHLGEAQRFLGQFVADAEVRGAALLERWLIGRCKRENTNRVPMRLVQQYGPSVLRSKDEMDAATAELEELDRVRVVQNGRRKTIEVNPALLSALALEADSAPLHDRPSEPPIFVAA